LIAFGTLGLRFVPAFYAGGTPLGWLDALFTATSAVCVTGLIVVDTATHFTLLGQGFLLLLIQVGGLGMITITTLIILSLGRRLSLLAESATTNRLRALPDVAPLKVTRDIVVLTFAFEAVGAVILLAAFLPHFPLGEALWHAVFHSVSAFCNAGFSTFTDSLERWNGNAAIMWTVMALIVAGGIGFLTIEELAIWIRRRRMASPRRLSLHSRIVLVASVGLIAIGSVLFALFEWQGVLRDMSVVDRVQNAVFMSVTARTAGFNSIRYGDVSDAGNFLTILLMSVGGSPGSTAGGLKTTTFFLIGLLAWSRMMGNTNVSIWGRTVPNETVQRAVGVFVVAAAIMTGGVFFFTAFELHGGHKEPFLAVLFEAVSAFNTVGLSMGATDGLDPLSRLLAVLLMFVGRIGPLSFAAVLALRARRSAHKFHYAREDISIG